MDSDCLACSLKQGPWDAPVAGAARAPQAGGQHGSGGPAGGAVTDAGARGAQAFTRRRGTGWETRKTPRRPGTVGTLGHGTSRTEGDSTTNLWVRGEASGKQWQGQRTPTSLPGGGSCAQPDGPSTARNSRSHARPLSSRQALTPPLPPASLPAPNLPSLDPKQQKQGGGLLPRWGVAHQPCPPSSNPCQVDREGGAAEDTPQAHACATGQMRLQAQGTQPCATHTGGQRARRNLCSPCSFGCFLRKGPMSAEKRRTALASLGRVVWWPHWWAELHLQPPQREGWPLPRSRRLSDPRVTRPACKASKCLEGTVFSLSRA